MAVTRQEPVLAAVVISRNEERWIGASVASVLVAAEPFEGADVVVVDSCSRDATVERARALPVRVVELRCDAPLSAALGRLVGQALTRSRYVMFVDGDTAIDPRWAVEAVRYLEANPRVAGVGGKLREVYYDGERAMGGIADLFATGDAPVEVDELGGNAVYRRAALDEVGSFNPFVVCYEESELTERLRHAGHRVMRLPVVLGAHHTGPRGGMRELSRRYRDNLIKGYGQTLRLSIRQGTFGRHVWRLRRYLQFQAAAALMLVAVLAGVALGDWRVPGGLAIAAAAGLGLFMVRSRSVRKPLVLIAEWAVSMPPMLAGLLERPRDPRSIRIERVIAREHDGRPRPALGSAAGGAG